MTADATPGRWVHPPTVCGWIIVHTCQDHFIAAHDGRQQRFELADVSEKDRDNIAVGRSFLETRGLFDRVDGSRQRVVMLHDFSIESR